MMYQTLTTKSSWRWITGVIVMLLLWGCAHSDKSQLGDRPHEDLGVTVVLPFVDMVQIFGSNASVRNPITSKVFVTGIIEEKAALDLTNELYRLIGQESGLKWGNIKAAHAAKGVSPIGPFGVKSNHRKELQALGHREGADTVMVGFLYAFRDRTGGDYGVDTPSQVAFELILMKSESGRIIWQRSFKETQKTLSEDLLQLKRFIKRKGRWVSAQKMANDALKEMLDSIPQLESQ